MKYNSPQKRRARDGLAPIRLNKHSLEWNLLLEKSACCDGLYLAVCHWPPILTIRARLHAAELQMSLSWATTRTWSSSLLLCNSYNSRYCSKRLEGKDNEVCPCFLFTFIVFLPIPKTFHLPLSFLDHLPHKCVNSQLLYPELLQHHCVDILTPSFQPAFLQISVGSRPSAFFMTQDSCKWIPNAQHKSDTNHLNT